MLTLLYLFSLLRREGVYHARREREREREERERENEIGRTWEGCREREIGVGAGRRGGGGIKGRTSACSLHHTRLLHELVYTTANIRL